MNHFDSAIVAQATEFVNALKAKKRARMPAMRFHQWPLFMTTVQALSKGV